MEGSAASGPAGVLPLGLCREVEIKPQPGHGAQLAEELPPFRRMPRRRVVCRRIGGVAENIELKVLRGASRPVVRILLIAGIVRPVDALELELGNLEDPEVVVSRQAHEMIRFHCRVTADLALGRSHTPRHAACRDLPQHHLFRAIEVAPDPFRERVFVRIVLRRPAGGHGGTRVEIDHHVRRRCRNAPGGDDRPQLAVGRYRLAK